MAKSKSTYPTWHFGQLEHGDIWGTFWSILLVKKTMFSFNELIKLRSISIHHMTYKSNTSFGKLAFDKVGF
jgi:hypothetical protein